MANSRVFGRAREMGVWVVMLMEARVRWVWAMRAWRVV